MNEGEIRANDGENSLRYVEFAAKDEPLRDDVRRLGALVGDVIREQTAGGLYERVEAVRKASIARREGLPSDCAEIEDLLRGLDPRTAEELVRAFSTYFQAVNLAEQVHRIRRGRAYLHAGALPQADSLAAVLVRLAQSGVAVADAVRLVADATIEPVFTAHPTEATRRVVLEKQLRIAERLLDRLNPDRTAREDAVAFARIRAELSSGWQTDEHPRDRPTVADEREHVLFYVAGVLYQILPAFHESIHSALTDAYGAGVDLPDRVILRVASWVGGDMDGNPSVDAGTIRETLSRHRSLILGRYVSEAGSLSEQLTQSEGRAEFSSVVRARIDEYAERFSDVYEGLSARRRRMPYSVLLRLMAARLEATSQDRPEGYPGPADFVEDLVAIERSLAENRGQHAGSFWVRRLRLRAETFGFHLATLDVRQDAREHRDVLSTLLREPEWPIWNRDLRTEYLRELLTRAAPRPAIADTGAQYGSVDPLRRALQVFQAIGDCRTRYGARALGPFVVSMAQGVDDVLTVLLLARWGGHIDADGNVPLDIAPLFETVPDLEAAGETLADLYADPVYRAHLDRRGGRQIVMVGYSDSSKDGGVASSRWSLHSAQRRMAGVSEGAGRRLTVFHGRGGTVSRGGGKVYQAVAALPAGALSGHLRLTEQGEVIDAQYGLPQVALRNLERMLGAVALKGAKALEPQFPERADWAEIAETLAVASRAKYRSLVHDNPEFYPFFRHATPIDVIERMAIGSRPSARRTQKGIEDLRAIPWVFAWTQTRSTLPGWFGFGSGLEAAVAEHGPEAVAEAAAHWPFLAALVDDIEMVLAKSDLEIAARYVRLVPQAHRHVFGIIEQEFERTVRVVLAVKSAEQVLEGDPTLYRSIRLRNPYVDPMNLLQVDLLARWRATERSDEALLGALLASVQGISRGLKNTG